jgi:PhnB protein
MAATGGPIMQITTALQFKGDCEAAFRFYEQCLGATPGGLFRYGGSAMEGDAPADWSDKIMHGSVSIAGHEIMGGDVPPDRYEAPRGISLSLQIPKAADGACIFRQLAEGGRIIVPFEKTFWAVGFGMVVDRFGIPWMINCEAE